MKFIPLLFCFLFAVPLYAETTAPTCHAPEDTSALKIIRDTNRHKTTDEFLMIIGKKRQRMPSGPFMPFQGHWGFHYGFTNFTRLPAGAESLELDWNHSFTMQFNLCKYSFKLSSVINNFGLLTGLGLEYQRLRFDKNNVSIRESDGKLSIFYPRDENPDIGRIKRSSLKNLYLTFPFLAEIQFPALHPHPLYVSAGIMGGLRMHTKTKLVYTDEEGKKHKRKDKGDFNTVPFKADIIGQIGYRNLNVWGSYTLTRLFRSGSGLPHLHLYTIGFGVAF